MKVNRYYHEMMEALSLFLTMELSEKGPSFHVYRSNQKISALQQVLPCQKYVCHHLNCHEDGKHYPIHHPFGLKQIGRRESMCEEVL